MLALDRGPRVTLLLAIALAARGAPALAEPPPPASVPAAAPAAAAAPAPDKGHGDDAGDLEALLGESVVTTASRSAERASVAPATIFNISSAEIFAAGIRTVDEALEFLGLGLYVARPRDFSTGVDVGAQGVLLRDAGRHVLVMLDGMILNNQATGRISVHEGLGVPMDLIDHIEVMLGPGSVVYGSNAMLAVINVVTKSARDLHGIHATAEIGASPAQDASGNPTTASGTRPGFRYQLSLGAGHRFKVGGTDGEVTAMLDFIHEESQSYGVTPFTMGDAGNQSFLPGQTSWGGNAHHGTMAPSGVLNLRLGGFRLLVNAYQYERGMPLVGTFNDPAARETQSGLRLDARYLWDASAKVSLTSRLYGGYHQFNEASNYGESFWCLPDQPSGCHEVIGARAGWVGAEQQLGIDWLVNGKVVTSVGYDARLRFIDSHPAGYFDLLTGAPSTSVDLPHAQLTTGAGAIFLQQVWRPLDWLHFNVGARLDLDSEFGARLSPRVAVVFTPPSATVIRLSYNEAFRAPSMFELTEFDPTLRITPSNLRAETVRSVELEVSQRVGRFTGSLRGYASFYSDFIESRFATASEVAAQMARLSPSVDPTEVVVNDNLKALQVLGGSAALALRLPAGLSLGGSFNYGRTQTPDGVPDQRLPEWFGNFRAAWSSGEGGYSVTLVGVYAAPRTVIFNSQPLTDSCAPPGGAPGGCRVDSRLDLRLTGAGPVGKVPGLSFRVTLGFDLNPRLPYAITTNTDTALGYSPYPDQPRLVGMVGLRYRWAGF